MSTSKTWIIVWNIRDNEHLKITQKILEDVPAVDYLIAQLEKGVTGNVHWQGYVVFHSPNKFVQIKKKFEGAHLEKAWGTAAQNKEYATKEATRDPRNIRIERGTMPIGQVRDNGSNENWWLVLALDYINSS